MFSSVVTKNLNWGILSKTLVTPKRWDGVKDENFNTMRVYWKILYSGGFTKNNIWGTA